MDPQMDGMLQESKPKPPVVRGARACTVCRAAKMKCVGAEDGQKQCQRCKRTNVECIFEKHRRGRKPGSKLSEASKMLRRLEKGLNSAKMKSQSDSTSPYHHEDPRSTHPHESSSHSHEAPFVASNPQYPSNEIPPPPPQPANYSQSAHDYKPTSSTGSRTLDPDSEEEDPDKNDGPFFPAKMIGRENQRNSFFRTILNPEEAPATLPQTTSHAVPQNPVHNPNNLPDPITSGIITEDEAKTLFDAIFLRLNPFVNLFDPVLHTVSYVRSKCPFLFTTLIMAGCKFFRAEKFKECQKLANEFAIRAFAESWKRIEVVQAFACLTYWKDPDDNRTWTFIGYACRMAVELGLNRYTPYPPNHETEFQRLERRNRERTYLVLFVHDRSLSMQTGRNWMLPEDDLVRNAMRWHHGNGSVIRPEDVILSAFVSLRRIAAQTTDIFSASKGSSLRSHADINYDVVLSNTNTQLTEWGDEWKHEMELAGGDKFHLSFLTFFRLHVRLFLNSFGIQAAMQPNNRQPVNLQATSNCYSSAHESLKIISEDFHQMHVLRYGQDSITVMSAYSAVFLLKLLRSPTTGQQLRGTTTPEAIHALITKTADSYHEASSSSHSPVSISASYHARFLRALVKNDRERYENNVMPIDPRLQVSPSQQTNQQAVQHQAHQYQNQQANVPQGEHFQFPASPRLPPHPHSQQTGEYQQMEMQSRGGAMPNQHSNANMSYANSYVVPQHTTELDAHYWKNMFIELGFGANVEHHSIPHMVPAPVGRTMSGYIETAPPHHHHMQQQPQQPPPPPQQQQTYSQPMQHSSQMQPTMHHSQVHYSNTVHHSYGP
ncbi:fungal-specific transcription factor domain-containing protein [Panaeolus papilionaceus]|nr:fungal-specific transcription factor domain-containing protein [Panaeolus papilionaceus]